MRLLAIESSCDDLAICLFESPNHILAMQTASQVKSHAKFGGIVPEIASREHLASISSVTDAVLKSVDAPFRTIEAVAVTARPGLVGSLLVGVNFAKGLALSKSIPLIGIDHLEAHLLSVFLEPETPTFPFLGLVVSGGHTHLYFVEDIGKRRLIGSTVDDAAGEAYDKVAKMLGLEYPGGPILDRLAALGDSIKYPFRIPKIKKGKLYTSFSGLKTAVSEVIASEKINEALENRSISEHAPALNLIASFQETAVRMIVKLLIEAKKEFQRVPWVVAGGVACNSRLRTALKEAADQVKTRLFIPRPAFCTDNAAMVAYTGYAYLERGILSPLSLNAEATGAF